ncbi:MAG: CvpA family protein [Pseudomonadales bacterium]|nr:CvpA family protein [Pseudomonadales bacterium]
MATIDIVILVIVGLSCLIGAVRGFIKEALSLASWVAAILVAGLFSAQLADLMSGLLDNASLRRIIAFALLFVGTIFMGTVINSLIAKLTSGSSLQGVDRVLGGLFGLLRGSIVVLALVFVFIPFDFTRDWVRDSFLVPHAISLIEYFQNLLEPTLSTVV